MSVRIVFVACVFVGALLPGCVTQEPGSGAAVKRLSQLLPVPSPAANPTTPDKVALGAKLWIDPRLSGTGKMACTTCHVREKGWTDGLALSRRDNGAMNTRHSPTMYNVGYLDTFYWDGRAPTLEAQVLAAWRVQIGADPAKATAAIAAVPAYVGEFQRVFGAPPSQESIVNALAAYLRAKVIKNHTFASVSVSTTIGGSFFVVVRFLRNGTTFFSPSGSGSFLAGAFLAAVFLFSVKACRQLA